MKLYTVTFTNEIVVLAANEQQAERIARQHRNDDELEMDSLSPMSALPGDWDGESIPYSDHGETRSIDELIDAGLASEYVARRDALRAAHKNIARRMQP